MSTPAAFTRRQFVTLGAAGLAAPAVVRAHGSLGPVQPPRALPELPLTLHDGRRSTLPQLLQGRVTALQLMFTGCSATCPLQGAVFAGLQARVSATVPTAQLLSITIDPLSDDAKALDSWRRRFGAGPRWLAAAPAVRHSEVMLDFLDGRAKGSDRHSAQTYLCDSKGRLAYRFAELASAADIAAGMQNLAARA